MKEPTKQFLEYQATFLKEMNKDCGLAKLSINDLAELREIILDVIDGREWHLKDDAYVFINEVQKGIQDRWKLRSEVGWFRKSIQVCNYYTVHFFGLISKTLSRRK